MSIDQPSTTMNDMSDQSPLSTACCTGVTSSNSKNVCHVLPCNIDYTGTAPSMDIYFNPIPITTRTSSKFASVIGNGDESKTEVKEQQQQYQAVMLRGRGLLANTTKLPNTTPIHGHVFQIVPGNNEYQNQQQQQESTKYLQSIQTFNEYVEWYHESSPLCVPSPACPSSSSRFYRAMEWMNIADCLHTPIPLPSSLLNKDTSN